MGRHSRKKRVSVPVRTGLLGASAAVAVGAVAVASGLVPGGEEFVLGGSSSSSQEVRESTGGQLNPQGGASDTPSDRPSATVSGSAERAAAPSKGASSTSGKSSATPSKPKTKAPEAKKPTAPTTKAPEAKKPTAPTTKAPVVEAPRTKAPEKPVKQETRASVRKEQPDRTAQQERRTQPSPSKPPRSKAPVGEAGAEAAVLTLVNEERAKVGCSPVRLDASLGALAGRFSEDMAGRGFFDHTDPDGDDPWKRAAQSGVTGLGAENIARGQADAETVMRSWMNSDSHRANILNCAYRTLGVGVSFAEGGPWWTQDFGF